MNFFCCSWYSVWYRCVHTQCKRNETKKNKLVFQGKKKKNIIICGHACLVFRPKPNVSIFHFRKNQKNEMTRFTTTTTTTNLCPRRQQQKSLFFSLFKKNNNNKNLCNIFFSILFTESVYVNTHTHTEYRIQNTE